MEKNLAVEYLGRRKKLVSELYSLTSTKDQLNKRISQVRIHLNKMDRYLVETK